MSSDEVAAKMGSLALDQGARGAQYRPLEGSEIRLLRVAPGAWDDQVSCTIHYEPLDEEPEYVALSYTWGDPSDQVGILLDGRPHRATRSLFTALRRFRQLCAEGRVFDDFSFSSPSSPGGAIYIWADALCINQADNVEKMREIPRMREVYTYCMRVCVWLGENDDDDVRDDGGKTAVSLGEIAHWLETESFGEDIPTDITNLKDEDNLVLQEEVRDRFGDRVDAFLDRWCKLGARPWFGRVWIIQEVALPEEEPILMAGDILFGFERYTRACPVIAHMQMSRASRSKTGPLVTHSALISSRLFAQYYPIETGGDPDDRPGRFGRALGKAIRRQGQNNFKATNAHDFLYSLIGLCGGNELLPPELAPDYAKPFPQVCEDYARCIMKATGSVAIMGRSYNDLFVDYEGHMERPLWVPDFRSSQQDVGVWGDVDPSHVSFVGDRFLKVRGFSLGRVIGGHMPLPSQEDGKAPTFVERLRHHHEFLGRVAKASGIDIEEAVSDWLTTRLVENARGAWTTPPGIEELQELYDHFLYQGDDADEDAPSAAGSDSSHTAKMFVVLAHERLKDEICALCKNGTVAVLGTTDGRLPQDEPSRGDNVAALSGCGHPFYLRKVVMPDGSDGWVPSGFCRAYYGAGNLQYATSDFSLEKYEESDFDEFLIV